MAIVRAVKSIVSTLASLKEKINYCRNPHKTGSVEPTMAGISRDPFKAFNVNKFLHGKANCQRLYKEYIISMQAVWPEERNRNQEYQAMMEKLMGSAMHWWEELGFQVYGAIHCNTAHPHIHLVVDTCNARSGKQLSQSPKMLADFKAYLSAAMNDLGLGESVLCQIEVSEEEMQAEDDMEYSGFPVYEEEEAVSYEYLDDTDMVFGDTTGSDGARTYIVPPQFFGLLEEGNRERYCRGMTRSVDNSAGRVMCNIIDGSVGREMCKIVDKPNGTLEHWNGR